jgi:Mg2+ and Co2+ transporter CorA
MDEEGHLLVLLHAPPVAEDAERRTAVVFWRNPAGEWKSSPTGGGLAALDSHLLAYRTKIHRLDEEVEKAKTPRHYFDVMRNMHPLQRATRSMLGVLQAARELRPDETRMISFRDQAADLERAIELVAADARAGMDYSLAESASLQAAAANAANREAQRLNRLAAFFFPLMTLVTVFGMNAPGKLMEDEGFWVVLCAGIFFGVIVFAAVAVRRK